MRSRFSLGERRKMGLFEAIFKKPKERLSSDGYYKMLNGYTPVFTSAPANLYEMERIRAAVHSFATFCSKLQPEMTGSAKRHLEKTLKFKPNPFMDTTKFLYRLATIFAVTNTAFIVPVEGESGIEGYYPILPQNVEVLDVKGQPYLRYTFSTGRRACIELERVGIMTQFQYRDDLFGETNEALKPTMQLIHTQNQGIINGVKNSAMIRFLVKISQMLKDEDIAAARERFTKENLSTENQSGVMIYDNKFSEVKQLESKPFTANSQQMAQINNSVYSYFGTNENILQNSYSEDQWNAYYEGKIEPFALQLSLVLSNMTFSPREISTGNAVMFTANRLQYASNNSKLEISTQLFDRGILTTNQVMDIWNMAHVEDGDKRYIRKEYAEVTEIEPQGGNGGNNDDNQGTTGISGNEPSDDGESGTSPED
jgi:hypothetical protein